MKEGPREEFVDSNSLEKGNLLRFWRVAGDLVVTAYQSHDTMLVLGELGSVPQDIEPDDYERIANEIAEENGLKARKVQMNIFELVE